MWREFKDFVLRGNVIDLAVAFIIGAAFGKIVTSLVGDILMPPVGLVLGRVNFSDLFISLSGQPYTTLAEAKEAGAPTINYGVFLNTVLDFVIVAFIIFLVIRQVNRYRKIRGTRECPYCFSVIPQGATRCAHCTSAIAA